MNTKITKRTWLNNLWDKGTKETIFETNSKKQTIKRDKINAEWKNILPFLVRYSATLPNIRKIINKHWHILNINNTFGNVFKATAVIAFRKNTSLRQIFGTNTIRHNQKPLKVNENGVCI